MYLNEKNLMKNKEIVKKMDEIMYALPEEQKLQLIFFAQGMKAAEELKAKRENTTAQERRQEVKEPKKQIEVKTPAATFVKAGKKTNRHLNVRKDKQGRGKERRGWEIN